MEGSGFGTISARLPTHIALNNKHDFYPFLVMAEGKPKTVLDLSKYIDKSVRVKFAGGREGYPIPNPAGDVC